ncbi:type VI secretion protein [Candidatus Magnetomorum sp. HK-1]|nr:type VI secretion protein [Candidatus Magnetomorum sp. HK-1]
MSKPAARITDMHTCPMITPGTPPVPHVGGMITGPGVSTVLIGNMPAATVGDMCLCIGPPDTIAMGSTGVLICGKPAARMGDTTAHGGIITSGFPTVLIGESSSGAGGGGGGNTAANIHGQEEEFGQSSIPDQYSNSENNPKFSIFNQGDITPLNIAPLILGLRDAAQNGNAFCEVCQRNDNELNSEKKANIDLSEQITNKDWDAERMLRKQAAINGHLLMESECPLCDEKRREREMLEDRRLATSPEILKSMGTQLSRAAKNSMPFVDLCDK